jgi:ubiquinone/menaquinone biosynthesis C-methylase UbiE
MAMGGQGTFYGAELQEAMLAHFFNRLEGYQNHPGFSNIQVVRARPDRLPLPDCCADRVLLVQVYHEIKNRPAYLKRLSRLIAPGGRLVVLDWRTQGEEPALGEVEIMGPPLAHRVSEKEAVAELQDAGFGLVVSHSGFEHNWCLAVQKNGVA